MKAVFVVERTPFYRLFSPVIDAALARGWDVECWHDYGQPKDGAKGYQFPSVESAPRFRHGQPVVKAYRDAGELIDWLNRTPAAAVVATRALRSLAGRPIGQPAPLWIGLQSVHDSLLRDGPAGLLSYDAVGLYSEWWLDWAVAHFTIDPSFDRSAFLREARSRVEYLGLPATDASRLVDPDEVRRRWGIDPHQPVVVLFPFPQGVGGAQFWPRYIYAESSRIRQVMHMAARGRFGYWRDVWKGWSDPALVKSLRRFCDRHGAFLLVKSRRKTPVPSYLAQLADACVYDESYYPATVYEALSVATLSISYYSASVFESAALGVPHICVPLEFDDYLGDHPAAASLARLFTTEEGGPFQFRGVSTSISIPEFIATMASRSIEEFRLDPVAHTRYIAKFLTRGPGTGAARTIQTLGQRLEPRDARANADVGAGVSRPNGS